MAERGRHADECGARGSERGTGGARLLAGDGTGSFTGKRTGVPSRILFRDDNLRFCDDASPLDPNQHAAPYAAWPLTRVDAHSFHRFPPAYPAAAVKRGEEGRVVFIALCDAKGHVYDARVWESSTHDRLDAALVKAARSRRWRCVPAMENGQAVPSVSTKIAYRFQLPDVGKSQHR
ncbi:energy transducer TonB [Nitrospirillum sp. BR 11752]|uniref:energy transducer TonB n=1 Tax=Nitrospirillum sp. BR 11752 TaxID=3104293 RepID=UPI003FA5F48C